MEVHKVLRLPRILHTEVHKVLRLPRILHKEVHKVLHLPQILRMEVHKVLRLPRILHVKKQVNTLITMEGRTGDHRRQPQTTADNATARASNGAWRFTKCCACHMEVHKAPLLRLLLRDVWSLYVLSRCGGRMISVCGVSVHVISVCV